MSYNGTVRCRHCYSEGHNRRTCPDLTENLRHRAQCDVDNGLTDSYSIRRYEKRVGHKVDGTPLPKAAKAANNPRRCTYCGTRGHNRRTCKTFAADKAAYVEKNIAFRTNVLAAMRAAGLGVGALLQTERWGDTYCWLVTKINWNGIEENRFGYRELVMGQNVRAVDRYNKSQWLAFPALENSEGEAINPDRHGLNTLVGPVALAGVPADFLTAESLKTNLKEHFCKDTRSTDYWDNYHAS